MKKSELKKYIKEAIKSKLSENYDDRIGDDKFGSTLDLFDKLRKAHGDTAVLDDILKVDVNLLEPLYDAMTFLPPIKKEDKEVSEYATEDDVEIQKAYNDQLERRKELEPDS